MSQDIRLVLLETSGNQAYIFATNKLREIMGASELLYRVGTTYVEKAVNTVFGRPFKVDNLLGEPTIDDPSSNGVEVIAATSGKALLLISGGDKCREFIQEWSRIVATEAPGLDATGVFSGLPVDLDSEDKTGSALDIGSAMRDVYERFEEARSLRSSPLERFQRLPVVADCSSCGGPAAEWYDPAKHGSEEPPCLLCRCCIAKRDARASEELEKRFKKIFGNLYHYFDNPNHMERTLREELEWVSVLHADGNGLGQVFLQFSDWVRGLKRDGVQDNEWLTDEVRNLPFGRLFIRAYREMSVQLEEMTRTAFLEAIKKDLVPVAEKHNLHNIPLIPIILGGDDLTVMMDGHYALPFTRSFLEEHQKVVRDDRGVVKAILTMAKEQLGHPGIGMSAGVSITKPHFPFSTSYDLAEELVQSAKRVKRLVNPASSALDFHILYDSSAASIREIRERLVRYWNGGGSRLTSKPFVVESVGEPKDQKWLEGHRWSRFQMAVEAMRLRQNGRRVLPSSQAHAIRAALHEMEPAAIEQGIWKALEGNSSYRAFFDKWRQGVGEGLFEDCHSADIPEGKTGAWRTTLFQDALEAAWFLEVTNEAVDSLHV